MDSAIRLLTNKISSIDQMSRFSFFSSFIAGFLAHAFVFTNTLIYHDSAETMMLGVGNTFSSGRWGLGILSFLTDSLGATLHSPFFDGILSIFFIALLSALIVNLLDIEKPLFAGLVGIILAVFPSVAATFTYMFTAAYYFFSYFIAAFALWIYKHKPSVFTFVIAVVLLTFSISIYQASLCVAAGLVFSIIVIRMVYGKDDLKDSAGCFIGLIALLAISIAMYLIINKLIIALLGIQMTSYKGLDTAGKLDIAKLPKALKACYVNFFSFSWNGFNYSYPLRLVLAGLSAIFAVLLCRDAYVSDKRLSAVFIALSIVALAPLATNIVYVMSTSDSYYISSLMVYSLAIYIVLMIAVIGHSPTFTLIANQRKRLGRILSAMILLSYVFVAAQYFYIDSSAYCRMALVQEEAQSWYTVLISEIKGCEGYNDELPVVFIGKPGQEDSTIYSFPEGSVMFTGGSYNVSYLVSQYAWQNFMKIHTGYNPKTPSDDDLWVHSKTVKSMPCYPDAGSIAVVDNAVVVKFANSE